MSAENAKKCLFVNEDDGIVIRMVVVVWVSLQVEFGCANLNEDGFMRPLDRPQIVFDALLIVRVGPLPAAVPPADVESAWGGCEREEAFRRQMFVEDEDLREESATREVVAFPQFAVCAGDHGAGFNQFQ